MMNPRIYGSAPFGLALLHGGPGAGGEMAPLARRLGAGRGVLELIQTKDSLEGQIEETKALLEKNASLPAVLAGYSWGAWLGWLVAACYPQLVKKLVLISAGSFSQEYVAGFEERRYGRLSASELQEIQDLTRALDDPASKDQEKSMARFGAIFARTEAFDPLPGAAQPGDAVAPRPDIFMKVWKDAEKLRRTGRLLELGRDIQCPVVAIHGDFDPHPKEGVEEPLRINIKEFKFVLLKNCGHTPWQEKQAIEDFYAELEKAIE